MERDISIHLKKYLNTEENHSNVLIVNGARQVGKTYVVNDVLSAYTNVISINLETEADLRYEIDESKKFSEFIEIIKVKKGFKDNSKIILFFDEAQESEKLGCYVRQMKEDILNTKVILTGSSMNRLFAPPVRIPVGRIEYLTVYPFSFNEFLRYCGHEKLLKEILVTKDSDFLHKEILILFDNYLSIGGMPEVVKSYHNNSDYQKVIKYILASQKDDFLRKEKIKSYLFLDALRGVANHIGFASKYTHISDNNNDARKVISQLAEWFIVHEVEQKGSMPTQNFYPKRYLYDIGLLRFIRESVIPNISAIETINEVLRTPLGGLMENVILLSILSKEGISSQISGWKKNNKEPVEIDFIIKKENSIIPIEVKATKKVSRKHYLNLIHYMKNHQVNKGVIFSLDKYQVIELQEGLKIINIPSYLADSLFDLYFAQFSTS